MRKATLALAVAVAALTIGATTAQAEIHVYDVSDPLGANECNIVTQGGVVSGNCELPLTITEPFVSHYDGYQEVEYPGCELTLNTFVGPGLHGHVAVHDVEFSNDCAYDAEASGLPWWGEIEPDGSTFTVDLPVDIYAGHSSYSNTHGPITGTKQFDISDPDNDNLWTFHYYEEKEIWPGSGFPEYYTSFGGDFDSQSGLIDIVDVN